MSRPAVCLVLSCALFPSLAFGQVRAQKPEKPQTYQKVLKLDYENDEVVGEMVHPSETMVSTTLRTKHSSLLKPRMSFVNEIIKSAESL